MKIDFREPILENIDVNELDYQITWAPIDPEEGCASYQIYVRSYDEVGKLGDAVPLGEPILAAEKGTDGFYRAVRGLEDYAGRRIQIYLVAEADDSGRYVDSLPGVPYEWEVPVRLPAPKVEWSVSWKHEKESALTSWQFLNGGMKVRLTAKNEESIPPGGSAYLLKAYVFETEEAADGAADSSPEAYLEAYPKAAEGGNVYPVQMDVEDSSNYYHDLYDLSAEYAGKWIRFYARISSGDGSISSSWVSSGAYQLPYVKLDAPKPGSDRMACALEAETFYSQDLPPVKEDGWIGGHTVLWWDGVDNADRYQVELTGSVQEGGQELPLGLQLRITEEADGEIIVETPSKENPDLWERISPDGFQTDPASAVTYTLPYGQEVVSTLSQGLFYRARLTAALYVEPAENGKNRYTLKLPDVDGLTRRGEPVLNSAYTMTQKAVFRSQISDQYSQAYVDSETSQVNLY